MYTLSKLRKTYFSIQSLLKSALIAIFTKLPQNLDTVLFIFCMLTTFEGSAIFCHSFTVHNQKLYGTHLSPPPVAQSYPMTMAIVM